MAFGQSPQGPYNFLSGIMNKGMSPGMIHMQAGNVGNQVSRGFRNMQTQTADRARAGGYQMPWLMGGTQGFGARDKTFAGLRAAADAKNNLWMQSQGQQMNAAGMLGGLAGQMAGIAMTPTQSATPGYVTNALGQANNWMGQGNDMLSGLGGQWGDFMSQLDTTNANQWAPYFQDWFGGMFR